MTRRAAPAPANSLEPELAGAEFEKELIRRHHAGSSLPVLLHGWFAHDTWTRDEGLLLLLGLLPGPFERSSLFRLALADVEPVRTQAIVSARFLDWSLVDLQGYLNARRWLDAETEPNVSEFPISSFELVDLGAQLQRYEDLWDSGEHRPRNSPRYFLTWAARKGLVVPWLDWAIAEGLVAASKPVRQSTETTAAAAPTDEGDPTDPPSDYQGADVALTLNDHRWGPARRARAWSVGRAAVLALATRQDGKPQYPSRQKLAEKIQQELLDEGSAFSVETVRGWLAQAAGSGLDKQG